MILILFKFFSPRSIYRISMCRNFLTFCVIFLLSILLIKLVILFNFFAINLMG